MEINIGKRQYKRFNNQKLDIVGGPVTVSGQLNLGTPFVAVTDPGPSGTIDVPNYSNFKCVVTSSVGDEFRALGAPGFIGQFGHIQHVGSSGIRLENADGWKGTYNADGKATLGQNLDLLNVQAVGSGATDWRWISDKGVVFASGTAPV